MSIFCLFWPMIWAGRIQVFPSGLPGIIVFRLRLCNRYDISLVLFGNGESPRDVVFYYPGKQLFAVRKREYKAHFITQLCWGNSRTSLLVTDPEIEITNIPTVLETPLLYNIHVDPSEKLNIAADHPEIIIEIKKLMEKHKQEIKNYNGLKNN